VRAMGCLSSFRLVVVALLLLSMENVSAGTMGRDFSGSYIWRDPVDLNDRVNVYVELSIDNAGEDITDAQIAMKGQFDDREIGNFMGPVSMKHGDSLTIKGGLTLSKNEFDLWRSGHLPRFVIQVRDEAGNVKEQVLDLIRKTAGSIVR
jgi:hypothetical protein